MISQGGEDYYPRKFTNLLRLNLFNIKKNIGRIMVCGWLEGEVVNG